MKASIGPGLALAMTVATPGGAQPDPPHPVRIVSERQGDAVLLTVVGDSAAAFAGSYALEVTGGDGGNANRSVQRGSVRLRANERVVLVRLVLGNAAATNWHATLRIRGAGMGYDEAAAS